MKLTANRQSLLSACQLAGMAISPRDVKPVLRNIKLATVDGGCTLTATDLEVSLRLKLPGPVAEEPGDALLPAARVVQILREIPDDEVAIDAEASGVKVTSQAAEFEMPGEDASAFPDFVDTSGDGSAFTVKAGVLCDMLTKTAFACASAEHQRFGATTGVQIEVDNAGLVAVAIDGRRIAATAVHTIDGPLVLAIKAVIARKAVTILLRLLDDPDEGVTVEVRPNEILFSTPRAALLARQVEGRFPNWRQVMPSKWNCSTTVNADAFLKAIRQAAIMTDNESKRVEFAFAKHSLTLTAKGADTGRSKVSMPIELGGPPMSILFDPHFLVDFLKVVASADVTIKLTDSASAGLFEVGGYRYVVVPLVQSGG